MNRDLDRSARLLDDAVSTTSRGLFKFSSRKNDNPVSDISITMGPDEILRMMNQDFKDYKDFPSNDFSVTMSPYEMQRLMMQDQTATNASTFMEDSAVVPNKPWNVALGNLYTEFFEVLQSHSGVQDVLEIVSDLARCTSDALKVAEDLKARVSGANTNTEKWLENERNTWRLLFILYQDRLHSQNAMDDDDGLFQYFGKSEKLCVEDLFKRDSLVRESQLVIDWLECSEAERDDEVLHFSDATVGWENTLHQLQLPNSIPFPSTRPIISHMDPDAPYYEKKPLHDEDAEDDARLARRIFREIRCGKLEEAQKLCQQCGHSWKAAMYEGWRLFHNPNIKEGDSDDAMDESSERLEIEGNANRDIWKAMALKYCKLDYISLYDRASIGVFCGDINAVLNVCKTWEDSLWAYMKSMVDIRVESEIRDCCVRNENYMPLPEDYWTQRRSLNEVFECLDSSKTGSIREQSRQRDHIIQKHIILDEIPKLVNLLVDWAEDSEGDDQFLRFATHLVLFLEQIGQTHARQNVEKIIESYIRCLMQMKETQLIAYYVGKLSPSNQVHLYSMYLENIENNEDRKAALAYGEESDLDVFAITKQVVENIRKRPHDLDSSTTTLQVKATEGDIFKINAIDWLTFYEQQRAECLAQCNAIVFSFLTLRKIDCAQKALEKLPANTTEKLREDENMERIIKEHLCYKAYLGACDAFNEWFAVKNGGPTSPKAPADGAQFTEKVAHQHRVEQYNADMERWKMGLGQVTKTAKTMLYNVLLFPEGWLLGVDARDADYLRSICIPEVGLLLFRVLSEMGEHEECVQLADIFASEKYQLYKVYSKEKLGEFLIKLCESSVALLNAKKDPWGNDTSA